MVNDHKAILKRLWKDLCTVTVREKVKDPQTKITHFQEVSLFKDAQPCKLSFSSVNPTSGGNVAAKTQTVTLLLDADLVIPPGSKITVTHRGRDMEYQQSGVPGVFTDHQEIPLELFGGWA